MQVLNKVGNSIQKMGGKKLQLCLDLRRQRGRVALGTGIGPLQPGSRDHICPRKFLYYGL